MLVRQNPNLTTARHRNDMLYLRDICKPVELELILPKQGEAMAEHTMQIVEEQRDGRSLLRPIRDYAHTQFDGLISMLKWRQAEGGGGGGADNQNQQHQSSDHSFARSGQASGAGPAAPPPTDENSFHPRLAICVTVYNESRDQLERTLDGLVRGLQKFKRKGIDFHEIVVVVVFDGIDMLNADKSNDKSMLKFFQKYDVEYELAQDKTSISYEKDRKKTLQYRHKEYKRNQEMAKRDINDIEQKILRQEPLIIELTPEERAIYHQLKIDQQEVAQTLKNSSATQSKNSDVVQIEDESVEIDRRGVDMSLKKSSKKNKVVNNEINSDDALKLMAMKIAKKNAENYLKEKANRAYMYQVREVLHQEGVEDEDEYGIPDSEDEDEENDSLVNPTKKKKNDKQDKKKKNDNNKENDKPRGEIVAGAEDEEALHGVFNKLMDQPALHMFLCVKYRNNQKLSSHLWFFRGFCEIFNPDYCVLIDCGLEPDAKAMWRFFGMMETFPNIGGCCGFMGLKPERIIDDYGQREDGLDPKDVDMWSHFFSSLFSIQKAQVFEYNFAHIIDKPFEAVTGFIHVLPGAFSAYRWEALKFYEIPEDEVTARSFAAASSAAGYPQSEQEVENVRISARRGTKHLVRKASILDKYLKTILDPNYQMRSIEEANMYLAEDRILCLEIFSRMGKRFFLTYVPDAYSMVDPVTSLPRMHGQRRRWINGSWFALDYVLRHSDQVKQSEHKRYFCDLLWFSFSMAWAKLQRSVTYFSIALYFTVLYIVLLEFLGTRNITITGYPDLDLSSALIGFMVFLYIVMVGALIFFSLIYNVNNKRAIPLFYAISTLLGLYMLFSFALMLYSVINILIQEIQGQAPEQYDGEGHITNPDTNLPLYQNRYWVIVAILIAIGGHAIPVLFNLNKAHELLTSTIHYLAYAPTYLHSLIIFAFCRIDDLSWGTKGRDSGSSDDNKLVKIQEQSRRKKFDFVLLWLFSNCSIAYLMAFYCSSTETQAWTIVAVAGFVCFIIIVRLLISISFYLKYYCCERRRIKATIRAKSKQPGVGYRATSERNRRKLRNKFEIKSKVYQVRLANFQASSLAPDNLSQQNPLSALMNGKQSLRGLRAFRSDARLEGLEAAVLSIRDRRTAVPDPRLRTAHQLEDNQQSIPLDEIVEDSEPKAQNPNIKRVQKNSIQMHTIVEAEQGETQEKFFDKNKLENKENRNDVVNRKANTGNQ